MGASSARIVRQIVAESVLLALIGGALGLAYAHFGVRLIMAFLADKLPASMEANLDLKVLTFTAAVSVLTGVVAGILPALHLSRANVNQALKQGLGRTGSDSGGTRTRSVLVVVEVALSLVLLIGAGLMIRSFQTLRSVNPGFDPRGVLTMTAGISRTKFSTSNQEFTFFARTLERVRALPGVTAAGLINDAPLSGGGRINRSPSKGARCFLCQSNRRSTFGLLLLDISTRSVFRCYVGATSIVAMSPGDPRPSSSARRWRSNFGRAKTRLENTSR